MLRKMIEELQKTIDQIRFAQENGMDEMRKMYCEIWDTERIFAEKVLGVEISIYKWEVCYKVNENNTIWYRTDWEALEK